MFSKDLLSKFKLLKLAILFLFSVLVALSARSSIIVANYPNIIFSISVTSYDFSFFNTAIT